MSRAGFHAPLAIPPKSTLQTSGLRKHVIVDCVDCGEPRRGIERMDQSFSRKCAALRRGRASERDLLERMCNHSGMLGRHEKSVRGGDHIGDSAYPRRHHRYTRVNSLK